VLNYLATRPKLANFVVQALVTLFARITKLGWFDVDKEENVFRNVIADITKFLQVCQSAWISAVKVTENIISGLR
jgi:exportin-7